MKESVLLKQVMSDHKNKFISDYESDRKLLYQMDKGN